MSNGVHIAVTSGVEKQPTPLGSDDLRVIAPHVRSILRTCVAITTALQRGYETSCADITHDAASALKSTIHAYSAVQFSSTLGIYGTRRCQA